MAETLIVSFSLKPGVEPSTYARWAGEVDVPTCRTLDACVAMDAYVTTEHVDGKPDVVEVITVTSASDWDAAMASPGHQDILAQWDELADENSLVVLHTKSVTTP